MTVRRGCLPRGDCRVRRRCINLHLVIVHGETSLRPRSLTWEKQVYAVSLRIFLARVRRKRHPSLRYEVLIHSRFYRTNPKLFHPIGYLPPVQSRPAVFHARRFSYAHVRNETKQQQKKSPLINCSAVYHSVENITHYPSLYPLEKILQPRRQSRLGLLVLPLVILGLHLDILRAT